MVWRRLLVFLDAPGYVQTEVVIKPVPCRLAPRQPSDAKHTPVISGTGPPVAMDSAAAQGMPRSSSGNGAAAREQSMLGSSGSSGSGAAVGAVQEYRNESTGEHSMMRTRSAAAPDLASADGWAIQRNVLPQAPHRGLALALAYHAARLGPGAAGCSHAAAPAAEDGPAPLRLAVIGAVRLWIVCHRVGSPCIACCTAAPRLHGCSVRPGRCPALGQLLCRLRPSQNCVSLCQSGCGLC